MAKLSEMVLKAKLQSRVRSDKFYPGLPEELKPFYCYEIDGIGHSLIVVLRQLVIPPDPDNPDEPAVIRPLFPVPIKTVLRHGYSITNDYLYCEMPYNRLTGVEILPGEREF